MLTDTIMYKALVDKDSSFEGVFVAAVKTTGIFCRPTCTARKPRPENVEFFPSTKEAIVHGYRPCKVCRPMEALAQTPPYIQALLAELAADPTQRFKDGHLRARGIEPSKLRRWFLKHHGITFHAYQRMFRINTAFKKIQAGDTVMAAAFDMGYDSLSAFNDSFKNVFGVPPSGSKQVNVIDMQRLETPLGPMMACAVAEGICLLEFTDRKMLETELKALAKICKATILQGDNPHFKILSQQLCEYFSGRRTTFSVPLFMPGTPFQQAVWHELQRIPYGTTRSYSQQAAALNKPEAVRAVASANGMNRIAILVPCHRVIGANGNLTGYGGGLWRKQRLLALEKQPHELK